MERNNRVEERGNGRGRRGLLFATEAGGPIADAAHRIEGELIRAGVLRSDDLTVHHPRASDELFAGVRMREVTLVRASNGALAAQKDLPGERGLPYDRLLLVLVIVIIDYRGPLRSPGRGLYRPARCRFLSVSGSVSLNGSLTCRRVCPRCYRSAYPAP